ncbi:hypothetical protein ACIQAC_34930 [Streptomyces sp. NPDC088387]|uniref:hypothetical protein n=1 Tax=Streptomyces sp. NPDC088387 TaxID=3365859 RepID=UPI0038021C9B
MQEMKSAHTTKRAAMVAAVFSALLIAAPSATAQPAAVGGEPASAPRTTHAGPAGTAVDSVTREAAYAEFKVDGARIRTGPGGSYAVAGLGYRSHRVTAHCAKPVAPQMVWFYLTNHTTGVSGWSEQSVFYVEGSVPPC